MIPERKEGIDSRNQSGKVLSGRDLVRIVVAANLEFEEIEENGRRSVKSWRKKATTKAIAGKNSPSPDKERGRRQHTIMFFLSGIITHQHIAENTRSITIVTALLPRQ